MFMGCDLWFVHLVHLRKLTDPIISEGLVTKFEVIWFCFVLGESVKWQNLCWVMALALGFLFLHTLQSVPPPPPPLPPALLPLTTQCPHKTMVYQTAVCSCNAPCLICWCMFAVCRSTARTLTTGGRAKILLSTWSPPWLPRVLHRRYTCLSLFLLLLGIDKDEYYAYILGMVFYH